MPNRLETYDTTLEAARTAAQFTLIKSELSAEALKWASRAVGYLKSIEDDADQLRSTAAGLETVAKLLAKVGPIKVVMDPLKRLIAQIEERAEDVERASGRLESKFGPYKEKIDQARAELSAKIFLLENAIDEIDSVNTGVGDAARATTLEDMPDFAQPAIEAAFDTVLPAEIDPLLNAIDRMESLAEELEVLISPVIGPAKAVVDIFNTVGGLVSNLDFLDGPLRVVANIIRPIEWALDAVSFVFDAVVNPVLNPVLNALGFNDLVDSIIEKLGLPSLNPFSAIEVQLDRVLSAIEVDTGLVDQLKMWIDDYLDRLTNPNGFLDVLALEGTAGSELVVGDDLPPGSANADNLLSGLDGDDMIAGGRGDDTLMGDAGNDVLIGGRGNDEIDGGDDTVGRDTAVILAEFSQMSFSYLEETETLIATHTLVPDGAVDQGTDTIRNVETVVFLDRAVDFADFGNISYSGSTPTLPARLDGDAGGVPTRDFLFGGAGIDTINGLDLEDYIEGRGGFDSLNGGDGNDWIDGGPGRDFIDGGTGIDTAVYRRGDGSNADYNRVDLLGDAARRPFTPDETPINIENLTGGDAIDWFWGDNAANRLEGKGNADRLVGFGGDDTLLGGDGADQLVGGRGNDQVNAGQGNSLIIGGWGDDTVASEDAQAVLFYGAPFSAWASPYAARGVLPSSFVGLPDLGFTPEDIDSELPRAVAIDLAAGTVRKLGADGAAMGTDTIVNINEVTGSQGDDTIHGSALAETVWGGAGADMFTSEDAQSDSEIDAHYGGAGADIFSLGRGKAFAYGEAGNDTFLYRDGAYEYIDGGSDADLIDFSASAYAWQIVTGDTALGVLEGDLQGAAGQISLSMTGVENIVGSALNDSIRGSQAANLLEGGDGNDTLEAFSNASSTSGDTLLGGEGRDTLFGNRGADLLFGGAGSDLLYGAREFPGPSGPVSIAGGNDTMFGEDGNDVFVLQSGEDGATPRYLIHGGDGVDEVDLSGWQTGYSVRTISTFDPDALSNLPDIDIILFDIEILRGTQGVDRYLGPQWANTYIGEGGNDSLNGRGGDDVLHGNEGDDSLEGGSGDDLIFGGIGHNILIGGSGIDTASFDPEMEGDRNDGSADWTPTLINGVLDADLVRGTATFTQTDGPAYANVLREIENIIGTANDDTLRGDAGDNALTGGDEAGADLLIGRGGNDTLTGGDGDDSLFGDAPAFAGAGMARINEGSNTGDYLAFPDFQMPDQGALTIEMLVQMQTEEFPNAADPQVIQVLMSYAVPGNANKLLIETNNAADGVLRITANGTIWDTPIPSTELADGDIHRLSVSLEAATGFAEVYIDGQLRAATINPALTTGMTAGGSLIIGQEQDAVGGSFDDRQILTGSVGDLRIFETIRSQREVADNWDTLLADPANEPGLVVNWQPDAATQTIPDAVPGGADLGVVGDMRVLSTGVAGDDILQGGFGDDSLTGGLGDDDMSGGAGLDTAFIHDSSGAVTVHEVTRGIQIVSADGADIIHQDVEVVQFTDLARTYIELLNTAIKPIVPGTSGGETITGTIISEDIRAYGGSDWIAPVGGNDTIDGGAGRDMLSFADLPETPGRENTEFRLDIDMEAGTAVSHDGQERFSFSNIERVTGTIYADVIRGTPGDDEIRGIGDYDWYIATGGSDTISGGNGLDMVTFLEWGGSGAPVVEDIFGRDGAPPSGAQASGVVFDLADGSNNTGLAAGLVTDSVERVTGSSYQDVFYGDANSNDFRGLGGYDWFVGSAGGRERYFGGDGLDTVTYYRSDEGVTASLRNGSSEFNGQPTGYGSAGDAARDLYFEIENLVGSNFDDRLEGNALRNDLSGLEGNDYLLGYGGIDYLKGGAGNDTLDGGAGSDFALFGGNRSDYTLTRTSSTEVTIMGADGTDSLVNVEYFQFDDQTANIWELSIV